MVPHSSCETCGFWLGLAGWLILGVTCVCMMGPARWASGLTNFLERRLGIPWYVQMCIPAIGLLMLAVGMHMTFLGGKGRYPGYPLDVILAWLKSA